MSGLNITSPSLDTVWQIRHRVMYPERTLDFVKLEDDPNAMHWGVEVNGETVSIISIFKKGKSLQFRKFATLPEAQRKGYGSMLLEKVMQYAEEGNFEIVWCNARTEAMELYYRFGMIPDGVGWEDNGHEYRKMVKRLNKQSKKRSMEIIPAIDIIDGKCVRLTQGDYEQKTIYNEHPLEVAMQFEDAGLKRLHLVDLDGAKAGAVKNWKVLEIIAAKTSMVIDFGGGIKREDDLRIVFESGAELATIGSLAVKDENSFVGWLKKYRPEKFLLGADVKDEKIAVGGWLETTNIWIYDFIRKYQDHGVNQVFCTDVSKDGKLEGPSLELYKNIISQYPELYFIASGGVSNLSDLLQLSEIGCSGAIVGKAIYEGRITIKDLAGKTWENGLT